MQATPATSHFAPGKAAKRVWAKSAARRLGLEEIHVAYILIDVVIDDRFAREMALGKPDGFLIQPTEIAGPFDRLLINAAPAGRST